MDQAKLDFFHVVVPLALEMRSRYEIPAEVTIAQAVIETTAKDAAGNWQMGASSLFRKDNNPFGMRIPGAGIEPGKGDTIMTHEWVDGKLVPTAATFQVFPTLRDAFVAHSLMFRDLARYASAWAVRGNWALFAVAIMNDGYSTDRPGLCTRPGCTHYAGEIAKIVEEYRLNDPVTLAALAAGGSDVQHV